MLLHSFPKGKGVNTGIVSPVVAEDATMLSAAGSMDLRVNSGCAALKSRAMKAASALRQAAAPLRAHDKRGLSMLNLWLG
jgi:hypothetical protein